MKRALSLSAALLALAAAAAPRARATCATNVTANPGNLQTFINAVPAISGGDYCINMNPGLYNEKITIPALSFGDTASRLVLQPASAGVEISSQNASAAVIDVQGDSVTLSNIYVDANGSTAQGIRATGSYLTLTNVVVIDTMSWFSSAAVRVDGNWATISNSSFTAQGAAAYGLFLTSASSGAVVSVTTATAAGSKAAFEVDASSISISQSYGLSSGGGAGLAIQGGVNTAWVSGSSFTATGTGQGVYLNNAAGIVLSNDYLTASIDALYISGGGGSNQIANSTMTSANGITAYVGTSGNAFTASNIYYTGSIDAGIELDGSGGGSNTLTDMRISSSKDGILFTFGSSTNTVLSSTVTCFGANGRALAVISGASESISKSVLWSSGLGNAMEIDAGSGFVTVSQSSITTVSGGSNRALYIATPNNTVSDSYLSSNFGAAVMIDNVSGNTIQRSTMTTASNVEGALYLAGGASNSTISRSFMFNGRGDALLADGNDNNNTVSQSTIASNGGGGVAGSAAHFMGGSNHNTVSGSVILGRAPGAPAVLFENSAASDTITTSFVSAVSSGAVYVNQGPHNITISFSTVTALVSNAAAVKIWASSMNTLDNDYLSDPNGDGVHLLQANYNTISNSTMYSNTAAAFDALALTGSSSNTISGSFVLAPSGNPAQFEGSSSYNTISQSTITTAIGAAGADFSNVTGSVGNTITQSYLQHTGPSGWGVWATGGSNLVLSQSTVAVTGSGGQGVNWAIANSTLTQSFLFIPNANAVAVSGPGSVISYSRIQASTGAIISGTTGVQIIGDTIAASGFGAAGLSLQSATSIAILGSSITASGAKAYGVSDSGGSGNRLQASGVTSWQGAGVLASGSTGLGISGSTIYGSTGVAVVNSNLTQISASSVTGAGWAGLSVSNAPAGSTMTVTGSTLTMTSPASYALYFDGAGSAVLSLSGLVNVHGQARLDAGGLLANGNRTGFGGDLKLGASVFTGVSFTTFTFAGALETPVVSVQAVVSQAATPPNFDVIDVNVANFTSSGGPFNAAVLRDVVAGSTVALKNGTSPPYNINTLILRGGTGPNNRVNFRSAAPGSPANIYVTDLTGSTVTLAQITDSFQQFSTLSANDGTSVDGGSNTNWNFLPFLDIELPGETWTEGVGKTGSPSNVTAGAVTVKVRATSSGNTTVTGSSIPVTLWGSDVHDSTMTQTLVGGTTNFSLPLRRAEPAPFSHMLTAVSTGAYNAAPYVYYDAAPVVPAAAVRLQTVLNGEYEDPGSTTTGLGGSPAPLVPGSPLLLKVRAVDAFWNKVPAVSDVVLVSTTGANLPQSQTLAAGATQFSLVVFSATASARDVVAMDLSNGSILASTSTPFQIFPVSVSSPVVSINISSGSVQTTLGGSIAGTASDPSAVTQVSVALQRLNDNKYYDWKGSLGAGNFNLGAPQYATATLASPNAVFTNWSIVFPDSSLWSNTSYYVLVRSSDPSNNVATDLARFTFNPTFGQVGSLGDGEGTASVVFETPGGAPTNIGCGVVAASMTFTTGPHGVNAGGRLAVHVPYNWTAMSSTGPFVSGPTSPGPMPGSLVVLSTTSFTVNLNPAVLSSATFGGNWFIYNAQGGLTAGQPVVFAMTGFTGSGPLSIGQQDFTVLSQGDPNGLFKAIAAQPSAVLKPGPARSLQFSDQQFITLGPLQTSATMQLNVFDSCGNSTNTATNVTAFFNAFNPNGQDASARYYPSGGGAPVSSLVIPGGSHASPNFYFETATAGPIYEQLTSSATFPGGNFSWATRYAQILASSVSLSGVSVDTGTLTPGVSVATMTPGSFAGAAVINFTLSNANAPWEVIISTDGTSFYPELVHRNGYGQPGRSVSWYGLDEASYPNVLVKPGGPYYVKIRVGGGVIEDTSLRIYMAPSAFIYGTVNSTGAYAYVNAQGPNTSFANFAVASSTGYFEIYGLQSGARYNIVATTGVFLNGQFVQLQTSSNNVTATTGGTNVGAFPFPTPTFLRLRVQIPQPAPFEFWGGFNAFSTTGRQAWGTLHYLQGADKSDDGNQSFGGSASTWTVVGVTPGTYNLQINLPQVSVSSALPNVVIPPGGATDLYLALQRKANVYGWVVIPSTTQYGTWISVQGTKAGDTRPSVFGGAFMQGSQFGAPQSTAVYSLFGLDPGSWTVTARGQGFASASTSVYISSSADIGDPMNGGLDLSLSSGTSLGGEVRIFGDSRNLPNASNGGLNVFINVYNPQTYSNGFAQVFIATSATLAKSTFSITGLDPGTYFVNTWVQGAQPLTPQLSTAVTAGGGFTTYDLQADSAKAAVTVWLPGPAPDFTKVGLFYVGTDTAPAQVQDFAALPGVQVYSASATWVSPSFSPGYFTFTAKDTKSGAFSQTSVPLADGKTTPAVVDLRGSTRTVSGTVVIAGNINLNINGTAVSVSSVPGVLAQATTNEYCLSGFADAVTTPTFHLELLPVSRQGNYLTGPLVNPASRGLANNCLHPQSYATGPNGDVDPFLAYVINISSDGSFSAPGVPPGSYVLRMPTNLDDVSGFGPDELPPVRQLIRVTTADVAGVTFTISQGVSVSGLLRLPAGFLGSRGMQVSLNDASGSPVRTAFVNFNNSNTAPYFMDRVPDGAYALVVTDLQYPQTFGASPITLKVSGASVQQDVRLVQLGIVKGKVAVRQFLPNSTTAQFVLIDQHNADQLPRSFHVYAEANPWVQGGRRDADSSCGGGGTAARGGCGGGGQPAFDQNGQFSITGVLPGTYDIHFESYNDPQDPSAIKLARSFAPGVSVNGGGITDIGTFNLTSAATLRGTVTDVVTGLPIANMPLMAQPALSQNHEVDTPEATTDSSGTFQLVGLDPSVKVYDIYAGKRDDQSAAAPPPYELKVAPSVDVTSVSVVNFAMTPAPYSVSGRILGVAGGPTLQIPFGNQGGAPRVGAIVFLNKSGVQPHDNPIADVMVPTDAQGFFTVPSLTTGTYKLTAVSLGYASYSRSVAITTASVSMAPITLGLGATLTGSLRKPDGSNPSQREVDTLVAVTNNFGQLLIGQLTPDANANTYTNYSVSGFQPGLSYRIMIFGSGANSAPIAPPEGGNVVFSTTSETRTLDLVLRPSAPYVFSKTRRSGSAFALRFELSQPLRSRQASDSDLTAILSTFSAAGVLSGWDLDSSRSILTALYTPDVSETSFTLRLHGYSTQTDPDSLDPVNPQFVYDSTFTFYVGLDGYYANVMSNMNGGTLAIDDDPGRVAIGGGSFQVDASSTVKIALAIAQEPLTNAPGLAAAGLPAAAANIKAMRYGGSAYPSDIFRAMAATPPNVSPLSAFYNVLLPLGLRTALQKPVPLTINYSTGTDPTTLNLYWYNAAANAYVLQQDVTGAPPVIDTVNHTITINVNHFSTFVLFNAGVAVITGNTFGGEFTAYNFPNPFDLSVKTVTSIHGAGAQTVRGTMISIGLPPDISGDGEVKIYDVAGERVRTISLGTVAGGQYYYQPWDGRNDSGRDVASGVYIGQVKVGDHSKFFKMALIK